MAPLDFYVSIYIFRFLSYIRDTYSYINETELSIGRLGITAACFLQEIGWT